MSYSRYFQADFSAAGKTGLSTVGYALYNTDGSVKAARTTSGVAERGTATGIYGATVALDDNWSGEIRWDTGDTPLIYASEEISSPAATADALLDRADAVESGKTLREALRIIAAVIAGKVSGAGAGVETFTGLDGSTTRVEVTTDAAGNRTGITYTPD
jgi:hypothetical protein